MGMGIRWQIRIIQLLEFGQIFQNVKAWLEILKKKGKQKQ